MRRSDAPPPGWYPDPVGGARLRWWDGLDWTDHRRAPPTPGERESIMVRTSDEEQAHDGAAAQPRPAVASPPSSPLGRRDTEQIMREVRKVARSEVGRAAELVQQQARDATSRIEPLISQYGDQVMRWIRNAGIVLTAAFVLFVLLQAVGQASLLTWLGERIDALVGHVTARAVEVPHG